MIESQIHPDPVPKLLAARHSDREPAANNVWDWRCFESWRQVVWEIMSDVLDDSVRAEFLRHPPEYVVGDDLSWLDEIVRRAKDLDIDSKGLMADRLVQHFSAMRACHATRTDDLASYYTDGLRPLDPVEVHARAREIFLTGDFEHLTDEHLNHAIKAVGTDLREGRVFFEANEKMLIDFAGHYLLYGGEYLLAIAAHLPEFQDHRQILKRYGTPTMFVCDVPLSDISSYTILDFAGSALEMIFEELLEGAEFEPDEHRGAGFSIRVPLLPENIVGHYHPTNIRDPHGPRSR